MINVRKSQDRGHSQIGWLDSYHTFSFSDYYDPDFTGFRDLLVINEDRVAPGRGFPRHGHRDMEIVSYVVAGALEHKDSMGNGGIIRPGDVQRMSAGTGVQHSEYNASEKEPVHFLQIWIVPEKDGTRPGYEQKTFSAAEKSGRLRLIASRDGLEGSVIINQDARLYASVLGRGQAVRHELASGRYGWVQVVHGSVEVGGHALSAGDGASISEEKLVEIRSTGESSEILLFDLA